MAVKVKIPAMFQAATGGVKTAEVNCTTVGTCLKELANRYPGVKKMLFDEGDQFSGYLNVIVNGQNYHEDFYRIPVKSRDEIYPLIMIEGG